MRLRQLQPYLLHGEVRHRAPVDFGSHVDIRSQSSPQLPCEVGYMQCQRPRTSVQGRVECFQGDTRLLQDHHCRHAIRFLSLIHAVIDSIGFRSLSLAFILQNSHHYDFPITEGFR